jgi:hypothetical protein
MEASSAKKQLCAPDHDGGVAGVAPSTTGALPVCDEGETYRCVAGDIVACAERRVLGRCVRGCFRDGAGFESEAPLEREAVFALLCSR